MRIPFSINEHSVLVSPYNTTVEKELLLASTFGTEDMDQVLEILGFWDSNDVSRESLSEDEKKVIAYKHREISLGDEIEVKFVCDHCGKGNEGVLEASGFDLPGERDDEDVRKLSGDFSEDRLPEYTGMSPEDLDDLPILEYENLVDRVRKNQTKISFLKECKCLICGAPKLFDLGSPKYIIEIMSDDSLMSLYKSYNFLVYFGHYSKEDVDSMYPFERSIFIGLVNKTKEDLNQ